MPAAPVAPPVSDALQVLAALLATGALAGVLAGLLGVGGGIVIVPVLYHILQVTGVSPGSAALIATGTSLATIVPTSLSSIRAHLRRGNIDGALLRRWGPPMVLGVVLATQIALRGGGGVVALVFGLVALLVAANMLLRAAAPPFVDGLPGRPWQWGMAFGVGGFSALMGIGGATLGVPLLTAFAYPAHRAVGTAAAFGLIIALPAVALLLLTGHTPADAPAGTVGVVNLIGFVCIVPLTVLLAPVGVRLGGWLDGARLKQVFALFLMLSGLRMVWQQLF